MSQLVQIQINEDASCESNLSYRHIGTDWFAVQILFALLKPYFSSFQWLELNSDDSYIAMDLRVTGFNEILGLEEGDSFKVKRTRKETKLHYFLEGRLVDCDGERAHLGMLLAQAGQDALKEFLDADALKCINSIEFDIFEVRGDEMIVRNKISFSKDYFHRPIRSFFSLSVKSDVHKLGIQEYVALLHTVFNDSLANEDNAEEC